MENPELISLTPRWVAVSKPAGWLTIPPSSGRREQVLVDWVCERHGDIRVVHRIDRGTSGVVLFARSIDDQREASAWFAAHEIRKTYDCLAAGRPSAPLLKIREPIGGAAATTQVEVKDSRAEGFLAKVTPLTGRRHQIRIHLSGKGYPLWGDTQYGGAARIRLGSHELEVPRVALHAARIELPTREVFESPWPDDFRSWVAEFQKAGSRA